MARLEGRVVGLDGVVDQQANYQRSGFVLAHRNIRFGGVVDYLRLSGALVFGCVSGLLTAAVFAARRGTSA